MLLCLGRQNLAKLHGHVGKKAKYSPVLSCKASNDKPLCSLMTLTRMTLPHKSACFLIKVSILNRKAVGVVQYFCFHEMICSHRILSA